MVKVADAALLLLHKSLPCSVEGPRATKYNHWNFDKTQGVISDNYLSIVAP
jgi:hypothetical protein